MAEAERRFPIGLNPDPDGSRAWACGCDPLAHAERQMMTDQLLGGIAGLRACQSHLRGCAGVLECGSALPLFGWRVRRPKATGARCGSRASPVYSSARTSSFPANPSRTLFNPCNPCNSFNALVAAQPRFLGQGMVSAPFLPYFCLKQLMPTGKIQFPVLFGSLWFTGSWGALARRTAYTRW